MLTVYIERILSIVVFCTWVLHVQTTTCTCTQEWAIIVAWIVVEAEHHIQYYFDDRKQLWCYLNGKGKAQLAELLNISLLSFCTTYEGGAKGADRHAKLLLEWGKVSAQYAINTCNPWWEKVITSYKAVSNECRSAVISAVFSAAFTFFSKQVQLLLGQLENECASSLMMDEPVPDDDLALYRLFGFSLHASIHYRKRSIGVIVHFEQRKDHNDDCYTCLLWYCSNNHRNHRNADICQTRHLTPT